MTSLPISFLPLSLYPLNNGLRRFCSQLRASNEGLPRARDPRSLPLTLLGHGLNGSPTAPVERAHSDRARSGSTGEPSAHDRTSMMMNQHETRPEQTHDDLPACSAQAQPGEHRLVSQHRSGQFGTTLAPKQRMGSSEPHASASKCVTRNPTPDPVPDRTSERHWAPNRGGSCPMRPRPLPGRQAEP